MRILVSRKKTMAPYGRTASCRGTLPRGKRFSKEHLALLGALCDADKQHRAAITRAADKPLVKCICVCVLNVIHGVVKLSASEKRRLSKHKHALRKLSQSSGNADWRTKKRAIRLILHSNGRVLL